MATDYSRTYSLTAQLENIPTFEAEWQCPECGTLLKMWTYTEWTNDIVCRCGRIWELELHAVGERNAPIP